VRTPPSVPPLLSTPHSLSSPKQLLHSLSSHILKIACSVTMADAISTSSLYPVVCEIDEEEYGTCCCIDGTAMSRFSLQAFPLTPPLPNQSMHQRSQSDPSHNNSKSAKRSLFQAKRRRSAVQRARSEGALIDTSDSQTISTEAEEKKFEESFVLTRQVSVACSLQVLERLVAWLRWLNHHIRSPFRFFFFQTDLSLSVVHTMGMRSSRVGPTVLRQDF
jgi:hypothetical protein